MANSGWRVKLDSGKQRELIKKLIEQHGSLKKLSLFFGISFYTFRNYYREERLLPSLLFNKILADLNLNENSINFSYLPPNWSQSLGGIKGMVTLKKRYPKKLLKWRRLGLINSHNANMKKIRIPKMNEKFAEFIGAYLGDGTLTPYFLRISGDSIYDTRYYDYLRKLVQELFAISPSIRKEKNKNTISLTIYSKTLCSFLNNNLKLNYGDKIRNKTVIPKQIISEDKLAIACLRGLMDTDGSVSRRGRNGEQFCIQFSNYNKPLLDQVIFLGKKLEVFTFFEKKGAGSNSWNSILKYFKIVGSSNLKHIIRFDLRLKRISAYKSDIIPYLEKDLYRNLSLPFKIDGLIVQR